MKKLRKKLFLSIAALAVCCATLVSTTYAWYTSNTDVSAKGVTGTSSASTDSLLLISSSAQEGSWSNTVTLSTNSITLQPVAYVASETGTNRFKAFGDGEVSTSPADTASYLEFVLYFRGATELPVYLSGLSLTNTTGATLPTKDILADAGGLTSGPEKKTYTMDVLRTLLVETTVQTVNGVDTSEAVKNLYDPFELTTPMVDDWKTQSNAHQYYNAVTGNNIDTDDKISPTAKPISTTIGTALQLGTTPAANNPGTAQYLKATFVVFINGWDLACFDAVQGQSISVDLTFSSVEDSALQIPTIPTA